MTQTVRYHNLVVTGRVLHHTCILKLSTQYKQIKESKNTGCGPHRIHCGNKSFSKWIFCQKYWPCTEPAPSGRGNGTCSQAAHPQRRERRSGPRTRRRTLATRHRPWLRRWGTGGGCVCRWGTGSGGAKREHAATFKPGLPRTIAGHLHTTECSANREMLPRTLTDSTVLALPALDTGRDTITVYAPGACPQGSVFG